MYKHFPMLDVPVNFEGFLLKKYVYFKETLNYI